MIQTILESADKFLCIYLGFKNAKVIPQILEKKHGRLTLWHSESFKRHIHKVFVDRFNLNIIDHKNKEKFGVSLGKIIASNLVVSFDEININKNKEVLK